MGPSFFYLELTGVLVKDGTQAVGADTLLNRVWLTPPGGALAWLFAQTDTAD